MAAAQCRSSKCTAERKGFRRELDSWRHKLIHCVGFESILEGVYGRMLLRDLDIFHDCEPEEVDDWSVEASCSYCSLCSLPLDKLSDQIPAAASPLSSPSDYSPCQAPTLSESSQSARRFLQAVFHKKDVPLGCDSNIPLVAQELMRKMIHQFAKEYASKSHLHTTTNGLTTGTSSPLSDMSDAPLDLTLSRSQEKEREPQPDGVLDLSKRNSACSATSSPSANHKASGFLLPTFTEELGDPGRRETQCGQNSALAAVLCSLCPAHRSLLYQILKLANQEQLLSFLNHRPVGQTDAPCCHCGVTPQDNVIPPFPFSECKPHSGSHHYPLIDCDHQGHSSTLYHPADSKSNCSVHHYPFSDCKGKAPQGSGCCCVQSCRVAAYPVFCLKSLHCISCQSLAVGRIDNVVCSFGSSPSLSQSPSLCSSSSLCPASSICCNHHNPHSCPCYSNHACLAQVRNTVEGGSGDGDPPCPVLKREQSPSPPPLSPIPSDINRKTEEKPPSLLHHRHEEGAGLSLPVMVKDRLMDASHQEVNLDATTEEQLECRTPSSRQAEQNPSGSLLQDVVDRFSEKLETIRPLEKDPPLTSSAIHTIEKEQPLSPSANLSEIITTVLHTGSDSDYNLSELFHRHDNNEAKSPNTRSRRRQEVLAAMATPADHASTRRHTLQIKRELAMYDPPYCRRKGALTKRGRLKDGNNVTSPTSSSSSDTTPVKEESEREMEIQEMKGLGPKLEMDIIREEVGMESVMAGNGSITEDREMESMTGKEEGKISEEPRMEKGIEHAEIERVREGEGNMFTAERERDEVKEEIQAVIVTEEIETIKAEEREREIASEEKEQIAPDTQIPTTELQSKYYIRGLKGEDLQSQIVTMTTTSVTQCSRACEIDGEGSNFGNDRNQEEAPSGQSSDGDNTPNRGKAYHRPVRGRKKSSFPSQSSHSRQARKSRRSIVPPQRFSSYVTEPRKMYFVACFSESIFNQKALKDKVLESTTLDDLSKNPDVNDIQLESREEAPLSSPEPTGELALQSTPKEQFGTSYMESKDQNQVFPFTLAATEKNPTKHSSQNRTDVRDCAARPYGRLRSSPKKLQESESKTASRTPGNPLNLGVTSSDSSATCAQNLPNSQIHYISPIKLMYVSQVMDKEGVIYSLKSAASGSSGQAEEPFDPCEESSWAGTPEKNKSQGTESATSKIKSVSSPLKSATSPAKSASTPPKSASSPPKSASSSPKVGARRSGEGTPPKRAAGTENQRSPGDLLSFHETTPPKRRPGRPKKLGPQLEKKVKRPIGRPRKQKALDSVIGANAENANAVSGSDMEENANKNLKITVVYGRSRRNKRMVSEGFDQLQTELHDAWQAMGQNSDLSSLTPNSQTSSGTIKAASTEWSELNLVRPVKESAPHSSSNIKCQKLDGAVPIRKPGRPAKVKISGISVTVTTVSPRQRKIQMNRDARQSPETLSHKKALLPVFKSAKEPWTINRQTSSDCSQTQGRIEARGECRDKYSDRPVAVRHSVRVRKPSIYLLHSVATSTSRSYSHSTALLRRSKKLLLNKASNERKQEEAQAGLETSGEKRRLFGQERKRICQDLSRMAGVSVDSIFPPRETLRWWAASAEEKTLNQELARRIRLVSDTWVSDTVENQEETSFKSRLGTKGNSSFTKKSRHSSVVRMLFDCPPNKPSSCSTQQLCSWFMQTTETQSLAIVKKASSRNPYELMHYPRSANKGSVCPSPQAERLRKHIKKFAKTVPKSPCHYQQAQERLRNRNKISLSTDKIKRRLFTPRFAPGRLNQGAPWWRGRALGKYPTTLLRARARFLTRKEREKWPKRQRNNRKELKWRLAASSLNGHVVTGLQARHKAFSRSAADQLFDLENSCTTSSADQTQEPMDVPKEHRLSSKAWSPETLKECRVFLRKINSPDNESTEEEEWDSCTVTLDDGSPSAYRFAGREGELVGVVKAVKTERKRSRKRRTASKELTSSATKSSQEQDEVPVGRQKGKYKSPGVVSTEPPQPPPAKMLRQSRVRGLTGPRWCDFVFEN
ncbi:streptococcal hemagglutinin isoform X2 [Centroberyx affinis]|uniref:streptococcal hemagglutinin isoform X2 n=1 Tax=Centroberyx affinis TaxID=166261 RepID=UPI003A5BB91E